MKEMSTAESYSCVKFEVLLNTLGLSSLVSVLYQTTISVRISVLGILYLGVLQYDFSGIRCGDVCM